MKRETENKQQSFSFKKGHTLPMSDENLGFLENCQKALLIGNLRGMIVDNNDDGKPSFFQTSGIGNEKAKMALTFYKRFSDVNKFTHFLVHEDDLQYYKDFIENFAIENCQIITHRLRGKSTEYKIAFVPPAVSSDIKSSFNIRNEYLQDMETLAKFEVGSDEQDKQIKYMLQKYVAICLNYTDGKLNEVYTDHGNITVIVYKDNKMFTNVYYKVNKITGEKIEFRDFDNIPKMFNDRINRFKGKKTMTYDFILMNPPYDKNLHLKIVEQSIPMLTDDGILVNLSPIRWLQDPLAKYKKTSDWYKFKEVRERIQGLIPISAKVCTELFGGEQDGAAFSEEIGIYYIKKNVSTWEPVGNSILEKVLDKAKVDTPCHHIPYSTYANRSTENFIVLKKIHDSTRRGSIRDLVIRSSKYGVFVNGKCNGMSLLETKDSIKNSVHGDVNNFPVICTKTPTEAVNVYNSFKTTFYRYVCSKASVDQNVPLNYLPWMGGCINPRTGKKGYESAWTDDDFQAYFGITDSEWEEIIETMKPYL